MCHNNGPTCSALPLGQPCLDWRTTNDAEGTVGGWGGSGLRGPART